jgi:hypothetical protein
MNARAAPHTPPHRCRNAALCVTAKLIVEWQRWVNMRRHGRAVGRPVYLQQRTYLVSVASAVECHVWTAPAMQEESDVSAKRSGAAMYPAFECSRYGRWP